MLNIWGDGYANYPDMITILCIHVSLKYAHYNVPINIKNMLLKMDQRPKYNS